MYARYAGEGEPPETSEHRQEVWIAKPDRWRQAGEGHVVVAREPLWWSWAEHSGYRTNEGAPDHHHSSPLESFALHLDPAAVIPQLDPDSIRRLDGALEVHARSRAARHLGLGLPGGADEHRLLVAAPRGVVLRCESLIDGEPFVVSELENPIFDEELDDGLFTLELPEGERFVSPDERSPRLTLEQAAERASFPVYALTGLPEGVWRLSVHYQPTYRDQPDRLHLLYHRDDARASIAVVEHRTGERQPWARMHGTSEARVERDGTSVTLQSQDLSNDDLAGLAGRLERV